MSEVEIRREAGSAVCLGVVAPVVVDGERLGGEVMQAFQCGVSASVPGFDGGDDAVEILPAASDVLVY